MVGFDAFFRSGPRIEAAEPRPWIILVFYMVSYSRSEASTMNFAQGRVLTSESNAFVRHEPPFSSLDIFGRVGNVGDLNNFPEALETPSVWLQTLRQDLSLARPRPSR